MRRHTHSIAAVIVAALVAILPAQSLTLRDVLANAGRYVVAYGADLATVMAEERYEQQIVDRLGTPLRRRSLASEIAFVHLADSEEWLTFRNVVRVDGAAIAGTERRLEQVLNGAPRTIVGQARALASDSARHNLGPLQREINAPALPLHFLAPGRQEGIRFDKQREETVDGERVWVVRFREPDRGGLIRRGDGQAVPAEGLLWIVPDAGRVVRASIVLRDFVPRRQRRERRSVASLEVTWRREPKLALWVPVEMRERYEGPWTEAGVPCEIVGTATYSNYRRFSVDTRLIDRR